MWEYLGIAAAFGLGWAIRNGGAKADRGAAAQALSEKAHNLDEAESRYLQTHQREVANLLGAISPDLMEKAYRKARRRQDEAIEGGPARIEAELAALSHKYPFFQDFEVIGTRHFVPYSDAMDHWSTDTSASRTGSRCRFERSTGTRSQRYSTRLIRRLWSALSKRRGTANYGNGSRPRWNCIVCSRRRSINTGTSNTDMARSRSKQPRFPSSAVTQNIRRKLNTG